ncbi:MAG: spore cortex biosynthesis protein YabQ [Firmicutes bacterium]|nr:spore cortex biosynthesis protein YabQ [Bacillota bacterium]
MEQPLLLQARQFLLSAALGAALGLHYDLLRGLRRWARWLTHPLDLWFALSVLAANLWFALRIGGGQFRIFALVGSALGAAGYFAGPSRLLLPVFGSFWKLFTAPGRLLARGSKKFFEKTGIFSKNIFSSAKKSVTIKNRHRRMRRYDTNSVGGEQDAPAKIITHYKTSDPRGHDLRDRDGGHPPAADQRLAPAGSGSAGRRRQRAAGQSGPGAGHRQRRDG